MAKAFSLASWNVEHFKDDPTRVARVRPLAKDAPATWSNGSQSSIPPSNLDHVVAADHISFKMFGPAEISVRGWPKEPTAAKQDAWIGQFSDHGLLFLEVQRV